MKKRQIVWCVSALLIGCSGVGVEVDVQNADATIEVNFEGECQGGGVEETDFGTVTYSKDDGSGRCVVAVDWLGDLVDMGAVKRDIEADAGNRDVTIERIDIRLALVEIRDASGNAVEVPTLDRFQGTVAIADVPLYALDGTSIDALVSPEGVSVSFDDPDQDSVLIAINTALGAAAPLEATAHAELTTTSTIPLQTNNPHRIVFRHDVHLEARASLF